jgi:hypothetical protein
VGDWEGNGVGEWRMRPWEKMALYAPTPPLPRHITKTTPQFSTSDLKKRRPKCFFSFIDHSSHLQFGLPKGKWKRYREHYPNESTRAVEGVSSNETHYILLYLTMGRPVGYYSTRSKSSTPIFGTKINQILWVVSAICTIAQRVTLR